MIQKVRMEVGDLDTVLPILTDDVYTYCLENSNENIRRASLQAAKIILMHLSINSSDRTVDVLSIKNSKAAEAYRQALILYIRNPDLNGMYSFINVYGSGISKSDMQSNNDNADNNFVKPFTSESTPTSSYNPWSI